MAGIKDYSTTNLNNTSLNGISVAEGMLPSQLNNAIRALMVNTRSWFNDSQWVEYGDGDGAYTAAYASATSFTIAGVDVTPIYHEGRRIKLIASTPGTIYGTISSSSFSTNTTVNVTWDSGSLSNEAITNVYIGALSKTNNSLPTGVIATATLADGSVTTVKIAADAVNGSKIADDSIDSEHYVDGSIDTAHIADSQITTSKIANSSITNAKLASNAVATSNITDLNVTSGKIAADAINGSKIADDSIDSEHIVDGSIDTAHIGNTQVTFLKMAANSIDSDQYIDGSIDTIHIGDSQITNAKMASNSVDSDQYVDGSIDTVHIGDSQITTSKIADSNVTASKLGTDSVVEAKIQNSAVTTNKINDDAVTAAKIADAVIVTNAEQSTHTPDDVTFFTTSASDGRYFRQDSSETIDSGDTWSASDAFIATTAAIDARVIDLVDDVGGFFPISSETNFPNTNPDVNDGAGTIVSIKEMATTRTPSGGTVTIAGGTVGGSTVTITGCGSTVLTAGFGVLVETSSTLNTYTFHRLVPKATEVTTVAAISSDITTVANDGTDIGVVAGLSSDIQALANIEDGTTATNAISNVGNNISSVVTTASNISGVNSFAERYRVVSSNPTSSLDAGDLAFVTNDSALKFYDGSSWTSIAPGIANVVDDTTPQLGGNLDLNSNTINGTGTINFTGDVTATNIAGAGASITSLNASNLASGTLPDARFPATLPAASGSNLTALNASNLASGTVPDARITGAYTGITNLTMSGDLTVDTSTLHVDSTNNRVGVGTVTPSSKLEVTGGATINYNMRNTLLDNNGEIVSFQWDNNAYFTIQGRDSNAGFKANWYRITSTATDGYADEHIWYTGSSAERMRIDSSGNVGIGTSSPGTKLDILATGYNASAISTTVSDYAIKLAGATTSNYFSNGLVFSEGNTSGSAIGSFDGGSSGRQGLWFATHDGTSMAERVRIDSSGNLGIGTSSASARLSVDSGSIALNSNFNSSNANGAYVRFQNSGTSIGDIGAGASVVSGGTAGDFAIASRSGNLDFGTGSVRRMRIDSSGNVGIGETAPLGKLHVKSADSGASVNGVVDELVLEGSGRSGMTILSGSSSIGAIAFGDSGSSTVASINYDHSDNNLNFFTNSAERMRIDSSGNVLVGKTSQSTSTNGYQLLANGGELCVGRSSDRVALFNRNTNDGQIVLFLQNGTFEGDITVSGTTVSYNGFTGTHWSRFTDNSTPTILRGTVLETLDEMCDWYNLEFDVTTQDAEGNDITHTEKVPHVLLDTQSNGDVITYNHEGTDYQATIVKEADIKHMKSKVSDTVDAKNVYGVFSAYDLDGEGYNDFYVASVGSFVVRIKQGETVAKGDLLQSNGDGTAKVQTDDNVKSSSFAKVLSTTIIETYEDGSYLVPCSLMC